MEKLNRVSNAGLGLFFGALLVLIIQLSGFLPSLAFILIVGPATMVIGLIIFVVGFLLQKKSD